MEGGNRSSNAHISSEDRLADRNSGFIGNSTEPHYVTRSASHSTLSSLDDPHLDSNENYDDNVAKLMSEIGFSQSNEISTSLIERAALIESIDWLSRHVPRCVLSDLKEEAALICQRSQPRSNLPKRGFLHRIRSNPKPVQVIPVKLPRVNKYQAALLFVDISGFTSLSQGLDLNVLSKSINSYFEAIVDEITAYGGDILKFAGDAILAEWRCNDCTFVNTNTNDEHDKNKKRLFKKTSFDSLISSFSTRRGSVDSDDSIGKALVRNLSLEDCVLFAATCGASIVKKCADYPIYNESSTGIQGSIRTTLNVHCGLGVGDLVGVHVGQECFRREYLILGNPIDQVSYACASAVHGELRASAETVEYLNKSQPPKKQLQVTDEATTLLLASREKIYFNQERVTGRLRISQRRKQSVSMDRQFLSPYENMDELTVRYLHTLLTFYVHPVVLADEEAQFKNSIILDNLKTQERLRAEAELRSVFTIFVKPIVDVALTGDHEKDAHTFDMLNSIMIICTSILTRFKGHLRQYIVDDKGLVLVATFGLRGSTFPNMISERALPASKSISVTLKHELGIGTKVGATFGKAYCGVVGGAKRHEYSVLGPSVNLSARLMTMSNNPGILVDDEIRTKSKRINFIALAPVVAKGYPNPVPVFQPSTAKNRRWAKIDPRFTGRKNEIAKLHKIVLEMTEGVCQPKLLLVLGDSGCGTSSFLVHALASTKKLLSENRKSVRIIKNISSENDSLIPFSLLRSIFKDLLSEIYIDEDTCSKYSDSVRSNIEDLAGKENSTHEFDADSKTGSRAMRLRELCEDMNAPKGFFDVVGYHLLNQPNRDSSGRELVPVISNIIELMAKLFIRCTSNSQLVILALDSVQWMDAMSWDVVQKIFEIGKNIIILCSSRPLIITRLPMNRSFWQDLHGKYKESNQYYETHLCALKEDEVREMSAITFNCGPDIIDDTFIYDIYTHCNGMPYFISEVLDTMVRSNVFRLLSNGKMGCRKSDSSTILSFENIDDILLHRLDGLSDFARKVLQFASAFGSSFEFQEVAELSSHVLQISSEDKLDHIEKIRQALSEAVNEGILDEFVKDDDSVDEVLSNKDFYANDSNMPKVISAVDLDESNDDSNMCYLFRHDSWLRLVTSLMLDSWKRDIHEHAALSMEEKLSSSAENNYRVKIKILRHYLKARNLMKAAKLALDIGHNLKHLGLNPQSVKVYEEVQTMWQNTSDESDEECIDGFSLSVLNSMDEANFKNLIRIRTALGQAIGSTVSQKISAKVFEDTLKIINSSQVGIKMQDRSIIFPIYSGLFFLLKYGGLVEAENEETYENNLIAHFVQETKQHGDPIHYGRALAMQGETFHRMGKYEEAIQSHFDLRQVYNPDEHSAGISAVYATDRCAQNFSCTASSYYRLGRIDKALEMSEYVITELMPKMDHKNVHNSAVMLYAIVWIMKDNGLIQRASSAWKQYVLDPFQLYFGKDGNTPCLPAFAPMEKVFNLTMYMEGIIDSFDENIFNWALDEACLNVAQGIDIAMGNFARTVTSINAEICLRLAKITDDEEKRLLLLHKGIAQAQLAKERSKLLHSAAQLRPIYDELIKMMAGAAAEET